MSAVEIDEVIVTPTYTRIVERGVIREAVVERDLRIDAVVRIVRRRPEMPWPCSGDELARAKAGKL